MDIKNTFNKTVGDVKNQLHRLLEMFGLIDAIGSQTSEKEKVCHPLRLLPDSLSHFGSEAGDLNLTYDQIRESIRNEIDGKKSQKENGAHSKMRQEPI